MISNILWSNLQVSLDELSSQYGEDIEISKKGDAIKYNVSHQSMELDIQDAQDWFISRKQWLDTAINEL